MEVVRPTQSKGLAAGLAVLNAFGVLSAWVIAAVLILTALNGSGSAARFPERALPLLTLGWVSGLVGLLLLIGLLQAVARINNRALPQWNRWGRQRTATLAFIAGFPLALLGGQALATNPSQLSLLLLPLCLILAVGLPLAWLLDLAVRGLKTPVHRAWGVSSVVILAGLPLAIIAELFFVIFGLIILAGVLVNQPELLNQLQLLSRNLSAGQVDPDTLGAIFEPLLSQPAVVFAILTGISVIVPLVEETFKPLGLWFLAKRDFTPAQGFTLGAVSGVTFALIESLVTLSSITGEEWALLVIGRVGTLLLHMTCSALVGWGLGLAWTRAKYWQFAGLFLSALAIHGIWNGLAQWLGLMPFIIPSKTGVNLTTPAEIAIMVVLGLMVVSSLVLIIFLNRRFNAEQAREAAAAAQAVPFSSISPIADPLTPPAALPFESTPDSQTGATDRASTP